MPHDRLLAHPLVFNLIALLTDEIVDIVDQCARKHIDGVVGGSRGPQRAFD
jgi:hypothetical protein